MRIIDPTRIYDVRDLDGNLLPAPSLAKIHALVEAGAIYGKGTKTALKCLHLGVSREEAAVRLKANTPVTSNAKCCNSEMLAESRANYFWIGRASGRI